MDSIRSSWNRVRKLLDATEQPIYVLDADRRLIYLNTACCDWLGVPAEALLGLACRYAAAAESAGPQAVADLLCPPPDAFHGRSGQALLAKARTDGGLTYRRATYYPLADDPQRLAVVVVLVAGSDEPPGAAAIESAAEAQAPELHTLAAQCRARLQGWHAIERLAGHSPAMRRVRAQVQAAAASSATVLVMGPPGSGREFICRAIHYHRSRDVRPLIPLECAILERELLAASLDALIDPAAPPDIPPATLVLNDVDALSAELQQELASRLRSPTPGLRIAATARKSLFALTAEGAFHPELAGALSTITIELPMLAQRRDDIPLLAQFMVEELNVQGERQLGGCTPAALDLLVQYHWPGDVAELVDTIRQAHARAKTDQIDVADLPEHIRLLAEPALQPRRAPAPIRLEEYLRQIETELIGRAMRAARGNKAKAARLLGLTRPRLYRRLVQLGLEPPPQKKQN
jgi:DNA-binding NtrC family response regulator